MVESCTPEPCAEGCLIPTAPGLPLPTVTSIFTSIWLKLTLDCGTRGSSSPGAQNQITGLVFFGISESRRARRQVNARPLPVGAHQHAGQHASPAPHLSRRPPQRFERIRHAVRAAGKERDHLVVARVVDGRLQRARGILPPRGIGMERGGGDVHHPELRQPVAQAFSLC